MNDWRIIQGDTLAVLPTLPDCSVHCCVTSPPYWGLRDYGCEGQIGLEATPAEYLSRMVAVFAEVRRVLRDDGTCWVNMGDSYAANRPYQVPDTKHMDVGNNGGMKVPDGLKAKDLMGMPWRLAFALQADGWYLRSDIIWAKPNPMPESVTDRPTKSHEYIFLLSKRERYYYDAEAIKEKFSDERMGNPGVYSRTPQERKSGFNGDRHDLGFINDGGGWNADGAATGRNRRTVWTVATQPYPEAHFATYPEKLIEPCVLAGCPEGGTVLDPFNGSGTTGVVAIGRRRNYVGIELNPAYIEMARRRIGAVAPLLSQEVA